MKRNIDHCSNDGQPKRLHVENETNLNRKDGFVSCLDIPSTANDDDGEITPRAILLKRACSIRELDDDSWLGSTFIDLTLASFAKSYRNINYLSADFSLLCFANTDNVTDIIGNPVDYADATKPIVMLFNSQNIHWNLLRVLRQPHPQLELFDPMGIPPSRRGGLSFRNVPRSIINWLNEHYPLSNDKSWLSAGVSVITARHQLTSFDCGVACLLYAEKCGQDQSRMEINDGTSQSEITECRKLLQEFIRRA